MRRRWYDFRMGHMTYLIFALSFANFILISHRLLIERVPILNEYFSSLWFFAIIFIIAYIPTSIFLGAWHRRTQLRVEQDINTDMRTRANGLWAMKTVKILDADTRRIGAYATVWGELDCDGERMTMQAVAPYVNKANPLMLWMHGLDAEIGSELPGEWDAEAFVLDQLER